MLTGGLLAHYFALVTNGGDNTVTPLDLTNPLVPVPKTAQTVGTSPHGIAISPNGLFALVVNYGDGIEYDGTVTPLDLINPLVPVAESAVDVGLGPLSLGPTMIYRR